MEKKYYFRFGCGIDTPYRNCYHVEVAEDYIKAREQMIDKLGTDWALANQWHEISRDKIPNDVDILIRFEDGSIKRYDEELPELLVTHWCEIPQFKEESK